MSRSSPKTRCVSLKLVILAQLEAQKQDLSTQLAEQQRSRDAAEEAYKGCAVRLYEVLQEGRLLLDARDQLAWAAAGKSPGRRDAYFGWDCVALPRWPYWAGRAGAAARRPCAINSNSPGATMDFLDTLQQRNAVFAASRFSAELKRAPSRKAFVLGCVDPRVDPMDVLGLAPGEAAIIRNIGGRVNSGVNGIMSLLNTVARANGDSRGEGWHFIVLHHTQCGIRGCYKHAPALLADYMGVPEPGLAALDIDDPYASVAIDVAALRANPDLADAMVVTGLVYEVETGLIKTVVPAGPLRA